MATTTIRINELILDQLAKGEMRSLVLIVSIRKALGRQAYIKGDLSEVVGLSLRKMVASRQITETEGVYSLSGMSKIEPVGAA
jgi:hypothetical protein